jgi:hypothetical protein
MSVIVKAESFAGPWPFVAQRVKLLRHKMSVMVEIDGKLRALNGMAYHTFDLPLPHIGKEQIQGVDVRPMIRYAQSIAEEPALNKDLARRFVERDRWVKRRNRRR